MGLAYIPTLATLAPFQPPQLIGSPLAVPFVGSTTRVSLQALQPLLTELTTAFGEMQQALKGPLGSQGFTGFHWVQQVVNTADAGPLSLFFFPYSPELVGKYLNLAEQMQCFFCNSTLDPQNCIVVSFLQH